MHRLMHAAGMVRTGFRIFRWSVLLLWLVTMAWHMGKDLPPGVDFATQPLSLAESQLEFLHDTTVRDAWGRPVVEQQIFDAVLQLIDEARSFIVLDFFLMNDDMGASTTLQRPLSRELADRLLKRKRESPNLQILLITDPINDVYGGRPSPLLAELTRAGIFVVRTDLDRLRDSNPLYSALWRMTFKWFGNSGSGWLPDPFRAQGEVSLRSWLALLNFKANHRKTVIADDGRGEYVAIVTSANPHDASSRHSNVAWRVRGELAAAALQSELAVAKFSGFVGPFAATPHSPGPLRQATPYRATYATEQSIRALLLDSLDKTVAGDRISMAMFYLSERNVVKSLTAAAARGVKVRLILDPNKDAFGIEKDGVPNRPVANELQKQANIEVRWYRTQGEQFHTKLVLIEQAGQLAASLGSANLTRRNLGNYNLEANIHAAMPVDSALAQKLKSYFETLWNDDESKRIEYTAPFGAYRDESMTRYWRYRFMEATGMGTF